MVGGRVCGCGCGCCERTDLVGWAGWRYVMECDVKWGEIEREGSVAQGVVWCGSEVMHAGAMI